MESSSVFSRYNFYLIFLLSSTFSLVKSDDSEALLALKLSLDSSNSLPWNGTDFCQWKGVKQCLNGRVSKLVLENLNLNGTLDEQILNQFDQLRVLSFKGNSISGQIPNFSGLANLKSLFLNNNNFSGGFPASISGLHRLKVVVLSVNQISGNIPDSLLNLNRLYVLYLQDNQLRGKIPAFNQPSLKFFNVSTNQLSGEIPVTPSLIQFNFTSFFGNPNLCGDQIQNPCNKTTDNRLNPSKSNRSKLVKIIAGSVGGFLLLSISLILFCIFCSGKRRKVSTEVKNKENVDIEVEERTEESGAGGNKSGGFSWEGEGMGNLVFVGNGSEQMSYTLEELLKASAETLGRGTMGSTYKAVMESGFVVTVKRLKDSRYPRSPEFRRHMDLIGKLVHPNLVPVRAYFQAKEERLIVYDYFPNGSLFSLIHGSRTSGNGKPLHWTSCLKIAEDLATGLVYIHQNPGLTHGNLKSSNVLLGSDFESCLTDYGLMSLRDPETLEESSATSLFYRAPECRDIRRPSTQQADVYSFGVLLLELLTGKTPFQDLVQEHGSDIPRWVKSVREEETDSGDEPISSNEASEEKLQALLTIAMTCVSLVPENRPAMRDVLKMISNTRAEAQVSSNSSDHSPGRWSDTVQSLPREEQLSI